MVRWRAIWRRRKGTELAYTTLLSLHCSQDYWTDDDEAVRPVYQLQPRAAHSRRLQVRTDTRLPLPERQQYQKHNITRDWSFQIRQIFTRARFKLNHQNVDPLKKCFVTVLSSTIWSAWDFPPFQIQTKVTYWIINFFDNPTWKYLTNHFYSFISNRPILILIRDLWQKFW